MEVACVRVCACVCVSTSACVRVGSRHDSPSPRRREQTLTFEPDSEISHQDEKSTHTHAG